MKEKIRDNGEKIKQNKVLPYLVGNVVEVRTGKCYRYRLLRITPQILDVDPEVEEDGANQDLDSMRKGKCAVIKTSTRQTVFLPLIGLVPPEKLTPGDLVGVNKDSYLVLDTLPAEFDSRVKAMEVDERPTETYTDIGGLEKQIEELVEAIVLPMEQADKFKTLGIRPPKGCLMYGPPGTLSSDLTCGRTDASITGTGKNAACPCLCGVYKSVLSQTRRSLACSNVYR
jgi:26S proteasome regulatory subunit T5